MGNTDSLETVQASIKPKNERSPSFPFIGLTKAVERTKALFEAAKRHPMRIGDVATAWKLGAKSSGTLQTIAALIAFGLVEDQASGEARKFQVSDLAFKMLEDQRPGVKEGALAEAALKPKLIAEYAEKWRDGRPADGICTSELHIDRGFSQDGAAAFLRVFDDTVAYATHQVSDKEVDTDGDRPDAIGPPRPEIAVGDHVRLEVAGQIVVEKAVVRALQEHNGQFWVFVEGSETGALMSDATLLEKAEVFIPPIVTPPKLPLATKRDALAGEDGEEMDRFTVDEGVVKITFPAEMTTGSLDDLESFFALFIKKAKRRAGAG